MKRQNILQAQVISFTLDSISQMNQEEWARFFENLVAFSTKNLTLAEATIDLDRKTLYSWKKNKLLPYAGTPKKGGKNKTWGRFSFIEICWLKMLIELRKVGIGIEKIQEIKTSFFADDFLDAFFAPQVKNIETLPTEIQKAIEEKEIIKNGFVQLTPENKRTLKEMQFSLFSCMIYSAILTRSNLVFYADGNGKFDAININALTLDPLAAVMDFHKLLSNESVVFINIKKIIADISGTHEHFSEQSKIGKIMSDASVNALKDIFKNGEVREVSIRVNENGRPIAWIRREMKIEDLEKEVRLIRKKGKYCDLVIKTRDGNVQYFEYTEILKL